MKKLCCIGILIIDFTPLLAQPIAFESRPLVPFQAVHIKGGFLVKLVEGAMPEVKIHSEKLALEDIITEVNAKGELFVKRKIRPHLSIRYEEEGEDPGIGIPGRVEVTIVCPPNLKLSEISRSGGGWLKSEVPLRGDLLRLDNNGSGHIFLTLVEVQLLEVKLSGSGRVAFQEGQANQQSLSVSGSGRIEAEKLRCFKSKCSVSGSGQIFLVAEEALEAKVSGTGSIQYEGQPPFLKSSISGSGKVSALSSSSAQ
ncbi:MAG: hypothetical protein OHK0053_21980 [Microscillaceae bacterium]